MNQNWQIVIFHVFANHFRLKYFQIFLLDKLDKLIHYQSLIQCNFLFYTVRHCVKNVRIQSYSGPHFSRIFLHSDWISPNTGKMLTRITPNTDTFYALIVWDVHLKLAHAGCKQVLTENRKNFGLPIQGSTFVI